MLEDIVAARPVGDYRLHLRFEGGLEGEVDLASLLGFRGVFERSEIRVTLHKCAWTRNWGRWCGRTAQTSLDPDVLYARLSRTPVFEEEEIRPVT